MGSMRSTFEVYFEKFSTTTVIRVFNFIRTAPALLERLFWVAFLIGGTSLTTWDVYRTVETYQSEPTGSHVLFQVVENGDSLNFSATNLCVGFGVTMSSLLSKYDNLTLVYEIIDNFAPIDLIAHLSQKLVRYHVQEDRRTAAYSLRNINLVDLENARQHYYHESNIASGALFTEPEIALIRLTTVLLADALRVEAGNDKGHYSDHFRQSEVAMRLYRFYANRETNFAALLRTTAEALCVLMQLRVHEIEFVTETSEKNVTFVNFCKIARLTWFGIGLYGTHHFACYRPYEAARSPFVFSSVHSAKYVTLSVDRLYEGDGESYVAVDAAGTFSETPQTQIVAQLHTSHDVTFSLDTWSTSLSLGRQPCLARTDEMAQFECSTWCRAEIVATACRCRPLISEFVGRREDLPQIAGSCAGSPLWNITDQRCRDVLLATAEETKKRCSKQCVHNCETQLFSYTPMGRPSTLAHQLTASTLVKLNVQNFFYTHIVEYRTMDERQLIAALGANLSLYLGASFLALVHIVVFIVKLPYDVLVTSKASTSSAEEQNSTNQKAFATPREFATPVRRNLEESFGVIFAELVSFKREVRRITLLERRISSLERSALQLENY